MHFCVQKHDPNPVELTVGFDAELNPIITVNASSSCSELQTVSFLGHTSGDRDTFAFKGQAGEVVTVTLEKDGSAGHMGDLARLHLQDDGGVVLDERSGTLPLEVQVTLSAADTFEAVVEAMGDESTSGGEPFRGHYLLRVVSLSGGDLQVEPRSDVEP